MGSCGYFSANVTISFSYKKDIKNENIEELNNYIKKNKLIKEIILDKNDLKHYFGKYNICVYLENEELYESNNYNNLDEYIEDIDDNKYEDEPIEFLVSKSLEPLDLEYVDLNILTKFDIKSINKDYRFYKNILSGSSSIYYENDNSIKESIDVSKIQELLLLPQAKIELYANGGAE